MKTIKYKFVDGTVSEVEVSDEWGGILEKLDKEWELNERRETRRHISIELAELRRDTEIPDKRVDVVAEALANMDLEKLRAAMETLLPRQRDLIREVFFEEKTLTEIADEYGVSYQALQDRLCKILERLRKFFE